MSNLVNDVDTYKNLPRDPTSKFQAKNNNFVQRLKNLKLIDTKTTRELTIYNAVCPRMYGQPKAHKDNLPLRPVVPNITAPTYKLAKYVCEILQKSLPSKHNTASSFQLCEEINGMVLPDEYIIISLDVVSLFTNIPRRSVIRNIINRWDEVKTNINLDLFLEMVEFCMEASCFRYNNKFYMQTYGTAMGSPLSPILAEIVLETIIDKALASIPFTIPLLRKYVDDFLIAVPKDKINNVLQAFNEQEERLQFTVECEVDRKLPFLDMLIYRNEDQTLSTNWYAKPIASGRLLNYNSFHQFKHKINVANNLINRVSTLARNNPPEDTKMTIHKQLQMNDYPKTLINRLIQRYRSKTNQNGQPSVDNPPPVLHYLNLDYQTNKGRTINKLIHIYSNDNQQSTQ